MKRLMGHGPKTSAVHGPRAVHAKAKDMEARLRRWIVQVGLRGIMRGTPHAGNSPCRELSMRQLPMHVRAYLLVMTILKLHAGHLI